MSRKPVSVAVQYDSNFDELNQKKYYTKKVYDGEVEYDYRDEFRPKLAVNFMKSLIEELSGGRSGGRRTKRNRKSNKRKSRRYKH